MNNELTYDEVIEAKKYKQQKAGFEPLDFFAPLFDWQKLVTGWAIRQGRAALFLDCGLGKTIQQLEWAYQVHKFTGGKVIILAPLAVAPQTAKEGEKFGFNVNVCRDQSDVKDGINITNYENLDNFDCSQFIGVVLDESSILKSFNGKTRIKLTEEFRKTPHKLCCTATPSPNDYTEFGQHADFLGICSPMQMLATYFINDTFNTGDWRLKGHAEGAFWDWVGSWAACVSKPSDLGFPDDGYELPELKLIYHQVKVDQTIDAGDELFRHATMSATTMHKEMRLTCEERVKLCAELVNNSSEMWVVWCNSNDEADRLKVLIPDAVEVRGTDTKEKKERLLTAFTKSEVRVIITKGSIAGYGLNWQHCNHQACASLNYSFEIFYQELRRLYRFGQTKPVYCHIIQAETEAKVHESIMRKIEQHKQMQTQMKFAAKALKNNEHETTMNTEIMEEKGEGWTLYNGDCVRACRKHIEDESVGLSVFSPPFPGIFIYSKDEQDMGNNFSQQSFVEQFGFLIDELMRVTIPGRECVVHCEDIVATKWKDGTSGIRDFSGDISRAFLDRGWAMTCRVTIWKSPVLEMQRTKAHGLLYKTLKKDSAASRVGLPGYLMVFRKPGENPVPIKHGELDIPLDQWQELASPVWMTVDHTRVLNGKEAREDRDERHISPLQLDIIERALTLWSAPNDLVFSPFAGIGSEGYCALQMGRRFVGAELKESYFKSACENLKRAKSQLQLI